MTQPAGTSPVASGAGRAVEDLGCGTHLFRWPSGFYTSAFFVTSDGVIAVDPINDEAASAYRAAIASVTDAPVVAVVYSHDHRDHIGGALQLAPSPEILAHHTCAQRLAERGDTDIAPPTRLLEDEDSIRAGGARIDVRYYGPNHSRTNVALYAPTDAGRLLIFVDVVEPDVAPYRELPDTDLGGLVHTLDTLAGEQFDLVVGGHAGPAGRSWAEAYGAYFHDLLEVSEQVWSTSGGQVPVDGEDGVAMTERVRGEACVQIAQRLRPAYGAWRGFDAWSPRNADRVLSYLITGN